MYPKLLLRPLAVITFLSPQSKTTIFFKFVAVSEIKSETIFHVNCLLLMIHMQYQGLLLPEIQESNVQFVMIGVLRVKTPKRYSFQSHFKLQIKRFLTPMFVITL